VGHWRFVELRLCFHFKVRLLEHMVHLRFPHLVIRVEPLSLAVSNIFFGLLNLQCKQVFQVFDSKLVAHQSGNGILAITWRRVSGDLICQQRVFDNLTQI